MSRKKRIIEKRVYIDPKYKSVQIGKFINFLMEDGKKSVAINIVYKALETLKEKTGEEDCLKAFDKAVNVTGLVVTKLDGTAKGGVIAAIARQCPKPIRYIGVGEGIDDLRPFIARDFVDAIFD